LSILGGIVNNEFTKFFDSLFVYDHRQSLLRHPEAIISTLSRNYTWWVWQKRNVRPSSRKPMLWLRLTGKSLRVVRELPIMSCIWDRIRDSGNLSLSWNWLCNLIPANADYVNATFRSWKFHRSARYFKPDNPQAISL